MILSPLPPKLYQLPFPEHVDGGLTIYCRSSICMRRYEKLIYIITIALHDSRDKDVCIYI